jgi:hypothetical protein
MQLPPISRSVHLIEEIWGSNSKYNLDSMQLLLFTTLWEKIKPISKPSIHFYQLKCVKEKQTEYILLFCKKFEKVVFKE